MKCQLISFGKQLWTLKTVVLTGSDPKYAEDADAVFEMLMGNEVGPRRDFITKNAKYVENLDA